MASIFLSLKPRRVSFYFNFSKESTACWKTEQFTFNFYMIPLIWTSLEITDSFDIINLHVAKKKKKKSQGWS